MIVDCHTHIWESKHMSKEWRESYERAFKKSAEENAVDLDVHHKVLTSQADKVVVLGFRTKSLGLLVPNEYVADYVKTDPDRLVGFMSIDPTYDDVENEIEHCFYGLGLRGIKISPIYQNFNPTDRRAFPIYEKANELNIPLLIHSATTFPRTAMLKYANPILFEDIAIEFPELKMIFAHLGYPWGSEMAAFARKQPNVYADCSGITGKQFSRWKIFNILVEWYEYCKSLEKIILGSDYPWNTTSTTISALRSFNKYVENTNLPAIPNEEIEKIINKNWEKVFPWLIE